MIWRLLMLSKVITICATSVMPVLGYCDFNEELNDFFKHLDASANVDKGDVYNGQKAGYATGGGIAVRNRNMNTKLATIDLPTFDAGCGGIDIYAGGFSFVNHKELVNTLKSIGSNSIGYAFLLGLETVSPQVANTIKQLQSWANAINSLNINSCETASQLVGAVWPKETLASQQICRSVAGKHGTLADFVASRQKCSQKSEYEKQMDEADSKGKSFLTDEYNVAWEAIRKQKFLAEDDDLAEFFMTLMGTIIVRRGKVDSKPSRIDQEKFLRTLIEGGTTKIYRCKKDSLKKCLHVEEKPYEIESSKSWLGRVKAFLLVMQNKILTDQELSTEEKDMLSKSKLPLYKIVNVLTAYKKGYCPIDLYQVSDIVAMDLLIQYLREAISVVRAGAHQLRRGQMYADDIDKYLQELNRIESTVRYYENRSLKQLDREFQMMQKIQMIEDQIASEIILE
jgi:conjugative transfer pilus assembly protein TraH